MKRLLILLMLLTLGIMPAYADTGSFTVINNGPLDSYTITTVIQNNDTFNLLRADFDAVFTTASGAGGGGGGDPLVFGGLISTSGTGGATGTFTQDTWFKWHFDFDSFNTGDSFSFSWDPDTYVDSGYSATVGELAGLYVRLSTTGGDVWGTMEIVGDNVLAVIPSPPASAPEPTTMLLLGLGLAGMAGIKRKRQ